MSESDYFRGPIKFFFGSALFLCMALNAQAQNAPVSPDMPYSISNKEFRWLEKKGFYATAYDWSNEEVNHYILAALEQRRKVQKTWLVGALAAGGSVVLGVVGVVGAFAAGVNDERTAIESIFTAMAVVGYASFWGVLVTTPILALIKSNKAKRYVRTAIQILQEAERNSK